MLVELGLDVPVSVIEGVEYGVFHAVLELVCVPEIVCVPVFVGVLVPLLEGVANAVPLKEPLLLLVGVRVTVPEIVFDLVPERVLVGV